MGLPLSGTNGICGRRGVSKVEGSALEYVESRGRWLLKELLSLYSFFTASQVFTLRVMIYTFQRLICIISPVLVSVADSYSDTLSRQVKCIF